MLELIVILSVVLELSVYIVKPLWRRRRKSIALPLAITAFGTSAFAIEYWNVWSALLVAVAVFRVINMLRVAENRMHEVYLKRAAKRSALVLGLSQLAIVAIANSFVYEFTSALPALVALQVFVATIVFMVTIQNIGRSKHWPTLKNFTDKELPTVTVAIPARNETAALEDCLRSIIDNNYPKFEVLVLDDCSYDRTPEIIKKFAQDGVRFIKGSEPDERWLAKNKAYDRLAEEASGEVLLFCGVDVRFGPETIRALVTTMLTRKKVMLSVMPRRLTSDFLATFIQPMRYWWEIAVPRRYLNRPSVLSTCWLIKRDTLKKLGGFDAVQHSILPEGYFAREVVKTDGYSFVRADDVLDVQTHKDLGDQRDTAIRMRYPQVRRRLEMVLVLSLAEVLFLLGPFVVFASALWVGLNAVQVAAAVATLLLVLTHVVIVQFSSPVNVLAAMVNYPFVVCAEIVIGLMSMYRYEFSEVKWKGRNVCLPVMHAIPKLPAMKD